LSVVGLGHAGLWGNWKSVIRKYAHALLARDGVRLLALSVVVDGECEGAVCATSMQRSTGLRIADAGRRWQTLSPVGRYARHSSSGCMWLWLIPQTERWASLPAMSGVHEHVLNCPEHCVLCEIVKQGHRRLAVVYGR
jgi:hypothetical protein